MVKLIWSPKAVSELDEICKYIAEDSEHYARLFAQKVITSIENIRMFPNAGRVVPEFRRKDLREKVFQNYRIVYRLKPNVVEIVAIVHGARLMPDI